MKKSEKVQREFLGVWIPREVWLDNNLTWMEKLFFTEIESLNNDKGCFASNSYFADFFNLSPGRVSQIINILIEKKYLKAEYIYDGKEITKRILRVVNKLNTYLENDKDNNKQSISKDIDNIPKGNINLETFNSYKEKNQFILYWNSLKKKYPVAQITEQKKYRKLKDTYTENNNYQDVLKLIKRLKNGIFGEYKFNSDFLSRNHISNKILSKKWTDDEIYKCLNRLAQLKTPGYMPFPDKEKLPRNLSSLIYNPMKGTSFFLIVFSHPPYLAEQEKTNEQTTNEIKYKHKGKMTEEEFRNTPGIKETDEFLERFG